MNLSIFVSLFWIYQVTAEHVDNSDGNFVPITQQPLKFFPQPRIVGGRDAEINQFPYQISLRLYNQHICGGSIISKNYIITAAHCVSTFSGNSLRKFVHTNKIVI